MYCKIAKNSHHEEMWSVFLKTQHRNGCLYKKTEKERNERHIHANIYAARTNRKKKKKSRYDKDIEGKY